MENPFIGIFSNVRNDIVAGLNIAILAVPPTLGVGIIATSSLGPDFSYLGALAGVFGVIFATLVPPFFGSSQYQFNGPSPAGAGILSGLGALIIADAEVLKLVGGDLKMASQLALSAMFFCSFIVGVAQVALGQLRMGTLIKLVPTHVITGVLSGVVFLIILSQLPRLLGLQDEARLAEIFDVQGLLNYYDIFIGTSSIAVFFLSRKFLKKLPPLVTSIAFGTILYTLLGLVVDQTELGKSIGRIPSALPDLSQAAAMIGFVGHDAFSVTFPAILAAAIPMTLIGALGCLVTATNMDAVAHSRHDTVGELTGLGVGNVVAASFGGLPSGGATARSMANYAAGGRTRLSHIVGSTTMLAFMFGLSPLLAFIPLSAVAGALIAMSVRLFDSLTVVMAKKAFTIQDRSLRKNIRFSLFLVCTVAVLVVVEGLLVGIVAGLLIELLRYLLSSGKHLVRSKFTARVVHSNTVRNPESMRILSEHGDSIVVLVLQGPLFFGNADQLSATIDQDSAGASVVILDFNRVSDIDISGALVLKGIDNQLAKDNKKLYLSNLPDRDEKKQLLIEFGVSKPAEEGRMFDDMNMALTAAEDDLIAAMAADECSDSVGLTLDKTVPFRDFSEEEIASLGLEPIDLDKGEVIIEEGSDPNGFFTLVSGRVSIVKKGTADGTGHKVQLVSYGPGVNFGELAILGQSKRIADVVATESSVVYFLSVERFDDIVEKDPQLANKIIKNLAGSLARRLAAISEEMRAIKTS